MYLFKCKCGCAFTLKALSHSFPICPDCASKFEICSDSDVGDAARRIEEAGQSIQVIPDNARISVTFNV